MVARVARFEGIDVRTAGQTPADAAGIAGPLVEVLPGAFAVVVRLVAGEA